MQFYRDTDADTASYLDTNNGETITEEMMLEILQANGGWMIMYIVNPSEKIQLEAVKKNGDNITFIKTPTEEVQFEAFKEIITAEKGIRHNYSLNRYNLCFVPTEKVCIEAIKYSSLAYEFIKKPTVEMLILDHNLHHNEVNCCEIGRRVIWLQIIMKMELPEIYNLPNEIKNVIVNFIAQYR